MTTPAAPLVVCESGVCEPPAHLVRTWFYGRPAWTIDEWERLNEQIDTASYPQLRAGL